MLPAIIGMLAGGAMEAAGAASQPDAPGAGSALFASPAVENNPLNLALQFDAMLQIGNISGAEEVLRRNSPFQRIVDRIWAAPGNLSIDQKSMAVRHLQKKWAGDTSPHYGAAPFSDREANIHADRFLRMALSQAGVSADEMSQVNPWHREEFERGMREQISSAADTASQVGDARASALRQLSGRVLSGEGGASAVDDPLGRAAMSAMGGQIEDAAARQREDILARANAGGYNPAAILGELERSRHSQHSALPLAARQFADQDFDNLMKFLAFGSGETRQSAAVTNQAALGSAGIAANQLSAASSSRGTGATGGQGANALGALGSTFSNIGLLSALGGGGGGGGPADSGAVNFSLGGDFGSSHTDLLNKTIAGDGFF